MPVSFCSLCFVFESRILLLGVQSFSSRVLSALGMAPTWQPWSPPSSSVHGPAASWEPRLKEARTDDTAHDGAGLGKPIEARSSGTAPGGTEAPFPAVSAGHLAQAAALPDGPWSPTLPTLPTVGDCSRCHAALMRFEIDWDTQLCNRCFNKGKGYDQCTGCLKGLWACERRTGHRRCRDCYTFVCGHCRVGLEVDELRSGKRLCNRCYNVWMRRTGPCLTCGRGLLKHEQEENADWCGRCCHEWAR